MATIIGANIYIDGVKHNDEPLPLSGESYDISDVKGVGNNFQVRGSFVYDDASESILSPIQSYTLDFSIILTADMITPDTMYWVQIHKSSDWPELITTKQYFVIYSTDHDPGAGGLYWAECDDVFFNGFIERGLIISGHQHETPFLIRIPISKSNLTEDTIFLYYHTSNQDGGNGGFQQTRLMTTTGGVLHTAAWTQRGRPLGIYNDDDHTGYCKVFEREDGTYLANHLGRGGTIAPKTYISESTDGLTFTRIRQTYNNEGMTEGTFTRNQLCPFEYGGFDLAFIIYRKNNESFIAVAQVDSNFMPIFLISIIAPADDLRDLNYMIEENNAYLYHKRGGVTNDILSFPYQMLRYNLSELDEYIDMISNAEEETADYLKAIGILPDNSLYYEGTAQQNTGIAIWEATDLFVKQIKTLGLWARMKAIYLFIGGTSAGHKFNLIDPVDAWQSFRIDFSGVWVHSATGAKPNGIDAWGLTSISPSSQNYIGLNHLSFYSRENTAGTSGGTDIGTANSGTQALVIAAKKSTGNFFARNLSTAIDVSNSDSRGFYLTTRRTTSNSKAFKNGVSLGEFDGAGSQPTGPIILGAYGNSSGNPASGSYSDREISFASYGDALTDQEQLDYYNAVQALQIALKREV